MSRDNPATKWVRYAGYLGAPLPPPKFTQATEVWGAPLGHFSKMYTEIIAKMAVVLNKTQHSNPTQGLGARHYIQQPHVNSWKHVQVLSEPHLVSLLHLLFRVMCMCTCTGTCAVCTHSFLLSCLYRQVAMQAGVSVCMTAWLLLTLHCASGRALPEEEEQ